MINSLSDLKATFPDWPFTYKWDGRAIWFSKGRFDFWHIVSDSPWFYAFDEDWLEMAKIFADRGGIDNFYAAFVGLYHLVTHDPYDKRAIGKALEMGTTQFGSDCTDLFIWLRYAMLAEERRRIETKGKCAMGKRLKRLALHQVLWGNMSPEKAANWSRGRRVRELNKICNKYGF